MAALLFPTQLSQEESPERWQQQREELEGQVLAVMGAGQQAAVHPGPQRAQRRGTELASFGTRAILHLQSDGEKNVPTMWQGSICGGQLCLLQIMFT